MSVADMLSMAFRAYSARWQAMFRIAGIIALPLQIATVYWFVAWWPDELWSMPEPTLFGPQPAPPDIDPEELIGFGVVAIIVSLLSAIGTQVAIGACYREVVTSLVGAESDWRRSLSVFRGRAWRIVRMSFLMLLLQILGLIACFLPAIYLFVAWSAAVPALVTEGLTARRALRRSRRLIQGAWWRAFAVILIVFVMVSIVGQFIGAPNWLVFETENQFLIALAISVSAVFGFVVFSPLYTCVATALYLEARHRNEGAVDMAELARGLDIDPPDEVESIFPEPPPAAEAGGEGPPFWPPPPGWEPRS